MQLTTIDEAIEVLAAELARYQQVARENAAAGNAPADQAYDQGICYGLKYAIEALGGR